MLIRVPEDLVGKLESLRKRLGLRSRNETIVAALQDACSAKTREKRA